MIRTPSPWGEGWDEGKAALPRSLLTRADARPLLYMDVRMPCSTGCTGAAPQGEVKIGLLLPWGEGWDEGRRGVAARSLLTRAVRATSPQGEVKTRPLMSDGVCTGMYECREVHGCTGTAPPGEVKSATQASSKSLSPTTDSRCPPRPSRTHPPAMRRIACFRFRHDRQ